MLFVGKGVPDQRVRGLKWLKLAQDGSSNPKSQWISDLYQHDFRVASNEERLAAASMRDPRSSGTSPPLSVREQGHVVVATVRPPSG